MSEMSYLDCKAQLPEDAQFCHMCGQALQCQRCNSKLLHPARLCNKCGEEVAFRLSTKASLFGVESLPPGYALLRISRTPIGSEKLLLMPADSSVGQNKEILQHFLEEDNQGNEGVHQQMALADVVEEARPLQAQQLLATTNTPQEAIDQRIWLVFNKHEGRIIQETIKLEAANSKKDYIIRLVYLFLYANLQDGLDRVPRGEVYKIIEEARVKDTNKITYINQDTGIRTDSETGTLRLNSEGRDRARKYLVDVFNSEPEDTWYPSRDNNHDSNNVAKRTAKKVKSDMKTKSNPSVLGWVSHESVRDLKKIPYETINGLSALDKALLGLYGIRKAGGEEHIFPSTLQEYLYDALEIQVQINTISMALSRAMTKKLPYLTHRDDGYRITPAGYAHIEQTLQQHIKNEQEGEQK